MARLSTTESTRRAFLFGTAALIASTSAVGNLIPFGSHAAQAEEVVIPRMGINERGELIFRQPPGEEKLSPDQSEKVIVAISNSLAPLVNMKPGSAPAAVITKIGDVDEIAYDSIIRFAQLERRNYFFYATNQDVRLAIRAALNSESLRAFNSGLRVFEIPTAVAAITPLRPHRTSVEPIYTGPTR